MVDDATDVLVTVGAFLANAGFAVQKATSGDQALELIANDPQIEVLVTDFAMPGLSGADLITQAMQVRPDLKTLVITGYPSADGLAEVAAHTKILVKPFRRAALIAEVKVLVGDPSPAAYANNRTIQSGITGRVAQNHTLEQYQPDWNREANQADGIAREPKARAFPL